MFESVSGFTDPRQVQSFIEAFDFLSPAKSWELPDIMHLRLHGGVGIVLVEWGDDFEPVKIEAFGRLEIVNTISCSGVSGKLQVDAPAPFPLRLSLPPADQVKIENAIVLKLQLPAKLLSLYVTQLWYGSVAMRGAPARSVDIRIAPFIGEAVRLP